MIKSQFNRCVRDALAKYFYSIGSLSKLNSDLILLQCFFTF